MVVFVFSEDQILRLPVEDWPVSPADNLQHPLHSTAQHCIVAASAIRPRIVHRPRARDLALCRGSRGSRGSVLLGAFTLRWWCWPRFGLGLLCVAVGNAMLSDTSQAALCDVQPAPTASRSAQHAACSITGLFVSFRCRNAMR
jgi:hypothetical protein